MARFLDTNILLRYFANDDPAKSPAALALLQRVERGDERVVMTAIVVFEVVFTLQRSYKLPKAVIRQELGKILSLRNLQLTEKTLCRKALDLYVEKNISYADAYHAVWMQQKGVREVYTWDREFNRIAELTRIEPANDGSSS